MAPGRFLIIVGLLLVVAGLAVTFGGRLPIRLGRLPGEFVADLLQPVDHPSVRLLLNRDMGHCSSRRGAVPMLLAGRDRDDVTRPNLLDRTTRALHAAAAGSDNQRLAQRMRVPRRPRARLEGNDGAGGA